MWSSGLEWGEIARLHDLVQLEINQKPVVSHGRNRLRITLPEKDAS